jgi:transcription elongation GreA/GreB family factor
MPPLNLTRQLLRDELLGRIQADLDRLELAHRSAIEGATHEEARPENSKDTRALEQSYLARGQALRIEELRRAVTEVATMPVRTPDGPTRVGVGAVVSADEDGVERVLFVAPFGGGSALADGRVQVVTPTSPLGQAIVGREAGDVCEVAAGGRARVLEILEVA